MGYDIQTEALEGLDNIYPVKVDVSDQDGVEQAVQSTVQRFQAIDILVNNAAIQPVDSFCPLHQIEPELLQRMLEINIGGYNWMARAVVPFMLKQGSGVIVNLASAHAHDSSRDVPGYGPTKAANRMQSIQWALEYARDGIRCVSISPGAIDTPMVRASLEQQGGEGSLANRHPLGRLGKPVEIAQAVLWACSVSASFVTATDIAVDGGLGGFGAFAEPYPMPDRYRNGGTDAD